MEKFSSIITIDNVRRVINDIIDLLNAAISVNSYSGDLTGLKNKQNGWYKWTGTLSGVHGTWIITKMDNLYSATNIEDPRVLLNSNDLINWYSPYGYWHA